MTAPCSISLKFVLPSPTTAPEVWDGLRRYAAGDGGFQRLFAELNGHVEQAMRQGYTPDRWGLVMPVHDLEVVRRIFRYGQQQPGGGWQSWLQAPGRFITYTPLGPIEPWAEQCRVWNAVFVTHVQEGLF